MFVPGRRWEQAETDSIFNERNPAILLNPHDSGPDAGFSRKKKAVMNVGDLTLHLCIPHHWDQIRLSCIVPAYQ